MAAQGAQAEPVFNLETVSAKNIPGIVHDAASFIGDELARNSLTRYAVALGIAVVGIGLIWLVKGFLARRAGEWLSRADSRKVDQAMAEQAGAAVVPLLYLFPLYFALDTLRFSPSLRSAVSFIILVLFITRTVRFLSALASFATDAYLRRHSQSLNSTVGQALSPIIRVLFWAIGITIILDNMGFQISSLLAGLGIAGVAVGLASQAILGDFFGYLVILMDRPFSIGDYITAGDVAGTVESIGLKTTRVRTAGGEVVVCPNGDITKLRIANFRLMYRRSRSFSFGVAYETDPAKVRAIPAMVREVAEGIDNLTITRVFFTAFGDSSLNFEVVLSVGGRVLDDALAAQQELYLGIMERFARENIVFAYPTRTLYFAGAAPAAPDTV
ncbi:MAG: mechanosensitive ion channel family protein [Deltaproteobacteria bacterium]|jgi:small-conductance mechanosensitive channel|nr:mechanosensitive ion channel family protein [Deltaproteobacteria bacterium]